MPTDYLGSGGGSRGYNAALDIDEMQRINTRFELLQKYAPAVLTENPAASLSMVQANTSDDDLLASAMETVDFVNIENQRTSLEQAPEDYQRAWFASQPKAVQKKLRDAGYRPVEERSKGGGFWNIDLPNLPSIGGLDLPDLPTIGLDNEDGINPLEIVTAPIGLLGSGVRDMADFSLEAIDTVFGSIPRQLSRSYRSLAYLRDNGQGFGDLWDSWKKVEFGERIFKEDGEDAARELVGDEAYEAAAIIASGRSVDEAARDKYRAGTPEYNQEVLRLYDLTGEPKFQRAVDILKDSKVSIGRDFARLLFGDDPEEGYRGRWFDVVSGTLDATLQFVDPTLLAGVVRRGAAVKLYGLTARTGSSLVDVEKIWRFKSLAQATRSGAVDGLSRTDRVVGQGVDRVAQKVAEIFSDTSPNAWRRFDRELQQLTPAWEEMVKFNQRRAARGAPTLADPDAFFDFMASQQGRTLLGTTKVGGYGRLRDTFPHVSSLGEQARRLKTFGAVKLDELSTSQTWRNRLIEEITKDARGPIGEESLSVLKEKSAEVATKTTTDMKTMKLARALAGRRVAENVKAVTLHVPESGVLRFDDPLAVIEFGRLADTVGLLSRMPHELIEHHIQKFAGELDPRTGNFVFNVASREQAARGFITDALHIAGAEQEVIDRWAGGMFKYAIDDADDFVRTGAGLERPLGVLPYQHTAEAMAIPKVKELIPVFKSRAVLNHTIGSTPIRWVDGMVGRYWTPAVLMRLSFIPRAYGEELLQHFFNSPKDEFLQEKLAQWAVYDTPIYKIERKAQKAMEQHEFVRGITSLMGAKVDPSKYADWTEGMYHIANGQESLLLRPFTGLMHGIAWTAQKYLPGDQLTRALTIGDNVAQYQAAWISGHIRPGQLAMVPWRTAKQLAVRGAVHTPLLDPEHVEAVKLAMSGPYQTWAHDMLDAGQAWIKDTEFANAEQALAARKIHLRERDGKIVEVEKKINENDMVRYYRDDPEFLEFSYRHASRIARDPVAVKALHVMRQYADAPTLQRVQSLAVAHGIAKNDPIQTLNWLKHTIDNGMSAPLSKSLRKGLAGDFGELEKVIAKLHKAGKAQATRTGQPSPRTFLADFLDEAANDPNLRAVLRSEFDGDFITGDLAFLRDKIVKALKDEAYRPHHAGQMRKFVRANTAAGKNVANRVPEGHTPIYMPMIDRAALANLDAIDYDQAAQVIARHLDMAGHGDKTAEVLEWALPGADFDVATLERVAAQIGEDFVPASLWGSTNFDVANAVTRAFHELAGHNKQSLPMVGVRHVEDELVRTSASHKLKEIDDSGITRRVEVKGGFSTTGRGSPAGDGKDAAMRQSADSSIVELANDKPSSSRTTQETLGGVTADSKRVMLARNGELRGSPLHDVTKQQIDEAHRNGATFVVGDMPGVDSPFIDYLDEIGASYTVFHGGSKPRIDVRPLVQEPSTKRIRMWRIEQGSTGVRAHAKDYKDAASFMLDEPLLHQVTAIDPTRALPMYRVQWKDGAVEWVDDSSLAAARWRREQMLTDIPKQRTAARRQIKDAAERVRYETEGRREQLFGGESPAPPPRGWQKKAEWDWFGRLSFGEQQALRKHMTGASSPDFLADIAGQSIDDAMNQWAALVQAESRFAAVAKGRKIVGDEIYDAVAPYTDLDAEQLRALFDDDLSAWNALAEREIPEIVNEARGSGVGIDVAMNEWADTMAREAINVFVGAKSKRVLNEIVERGARDPRALTFESMLEIPPDELPAVIPGPKVVPEVPMNLWARFTRSFFDDIVGPAGSAITRDQRFVGLVYNNLRALKPLARERFLNPELEDAAKALAAKAGIDDVEEFAAAWGKMPKALRDPSADPADVNQALFGKSGLNIPDPGLTTPWVDKTGRKYPAAIGTDGTVNGESYRLVMDARRAGELPFPAHWLDGDEIASLRRWGATREIYEQQLQEMVLTGAWKDVAPFIDDRRFRSAFQEIVGSFMPFQFAEEQFLKRWMRTLNQSPETIAQAMLTMNGLRAVGVIKTDPESGEDYYIYPGSAQMTWAIGKGINRIFGREVVAPIAAPLTGSVKYSMPGLDGTVPGVPNGGPLFGAAVAGLANIFPEIHDVAGPFTRGSAEGRSIASYFVPTTLVRAWDVLNGDKTQIASASIEAMAYLEANGNGLPDNASPAAVDLYQQRVKNHARILMGVRALYGFTGPAAPSRLAPGHEISEELVELLRSGVPITDAMQLFLKKNPDATPFTVFSSKSTSEASLPQTAEALDWMVDNEGYLSSFQQAAPWLIPAKQPEDEYEQRAYFEQLSQGLRQKLDMPEWYESMKFRQAADDYFKSVRRFDEEKYALRDDPQAKAALQAEWDVWKKAYMAQHPLFAARLQDPESVFRRRQTIEEMALIVNDPDAPDTPVMESMRDLIASWNQYQTDYRSLSTSRVGAVVDAKQELKVDFALWAEGFLHKHPEVRDFFRSIIEPQLDLNMEQEHLVEAG